MPLNPYIVGNAVGGGPAFVGRDDILQEVYRTLQHPRHNAILLHGQRRIGKTSILRELETKLPSKGNYCPVFFDLLGKAHQSIAQIVQDLANHITDKLGQEKPALGEDPKNYFYNTWLPNLLQTGEKSFVLLFDEFDTLDDELAKQTRWELFRYLSDLLASQSERLNIVFVIGRNINDLTEVTQALFKGVQSKLVSLLNREDALKLISLSKDTFRWTPKAEEKVWQLTQGHPYLTQQVCHCVWEHLYGERENTKTPSVSPKHIEEVIPTVLERSENMFVWLWNDLKAAQKVFLSAMNKVVTKSQLEEVIPTVLERSENMFIWLWNGLEAAQKVFLSAVAESGDKIVTKDQLNNSLSKIGIKISVPALENAPQSLEPNGWDLIKEERNGYRFKVELLRLLVAKYKPLHLVKDELNRLEPEANSYYEAALKLRTEKNLEEALEKLGRVLRLNPNHINTVKLQAEILLEDGKLTEAYKKLKDLFDNHPDEARPLLVQTLWLMAQSSKKEGEQLDYYDQILKLDDNHANAKKEIRKIWIRRGDQAVRDEDCRRAVKAYRQGGLKDKAFQVRRDCFWKKYSKPMRMVAEFIGGFILVAVVSYFTPGGTLFLGYGYGHDRVVLKQSESQKEGYRLAYDGNPLVGKINSIALTLREKPVKVMLEYAKNQTIELTTQNSQPPYLYETPKEKTNLFSDDNLPLVFSFQLNDIEGSECQVKNVKYCDINPKPLIDIPFFLKNIVWQIWAVLGGLLAVVLGERIFFRKRPQREELN